MKSFLYITCCVIIIIESFFIGRLISHWQQQTTLSESPVIKIIILNDSSREPLGRVNINILLKEKISGLYSFTTTDDGIVNLYGKDAEYFFNKDVALDIWGGRELGCENEQITTRLQAINEFFLHCNLIIPTVSSTPTLFLTPTTTFSPTPSPSPTPTASPTATNTATMTATSTNTPIPFVPTATPSPTVTPLIPRAAVTLISPANEQVFVGPVDIKLTWAGELQADDYYWVDIGFTPAENCDGAWQNHAWTRETSHVIHIPSVYNAMCPTKRAVTWTVYIGQPTNGLENAEGKLLSPQGEIRTLQWDVSGGGSSNPVEVVVTPDPGAGTGPKSIY